MTRFNSAAERCYTTLIDTRTIYRSQAAFGIQRFYRSAFTVAWRIQNEKDADYRVPLQLHYGVELAIKMAELLLSRATPAEYETFYVSDPKAYRSDVLETLVEIVYEALTAIANRFKGFDDPFWDTAISVFLDAFSSVGDQPNGLSPFQQRLALKIIKKLEDNMNGYYPAICRVLLACVGPYRTTAPQLNRTAFNILKDAIYYELQKLPILAAKKPEKVADYFPDNVTYDAATTDLVHRYRGGAQTVTKMSALNLGPISLVTNDVRRASAG